MTRISGHCGGALTAVASAVLLAACGGGTSNTAPTTQSAAIQGTVASGNPISQALVTATDVNGKTAAATADASGNYTLATTSLSAPIALVATDPSGQVSPMVSVLPNLPSAGKTSVANVTTLTTAQSALLTSDGNPLDFVTPGAATTLSTVTATSVQAATGTLDTYLANLLVATGLPANFDPVGTTFTANHTGADALIDLVSIVPQGSVTYLAYKTPSSASSQNAAYLTLNNTSTPTNTPVAPAISAAAVANVVSLQNYLSTLPAALKSCGAAGGTGSACSGLIDASYLDNGFANITLYDSDLTNPSLNLSGSVPLVVLIDNTAGTSALIGIPYGLSSATGSQGQHTLYTTVQQTPSGTWDIIGNQLPYNLSVSTRTTYRNFLDSYIDPATSNPDVSFFDAGVSLQVGSLGTSGSGANISYVNVTGPGLPGGTSCSPAATSSSNPCGVWLARSGNNMNLLNHAPTAALTSPPSSGISGTSEFRWSWAPSTYVPPKSVEYWTPGGTPVNVATLPPSAVYQFTLYDASGKTIGTYSVTNPNSFADASLGQSAYSAGYFPVLGNDVTSSFLTPTGSLAGLQSSVSVDFTLPPANSPLTATGVFIQTADVANCTVEPSAVSVAPGVTSATVTASGTCGNGTAEAFWAINSSSDAAYRLVQLRSKNAHGVLFYLNQTYRSSNGAPSAS